VDGLFKEYENFSLNNISFNIEKGTINGFIGNNGAGKTTTIRCILGLAPYSDGKITVDGTTLFEDEEKYKSALGVVFDSGHYYENFTLDQMKSIVAKSFSNWNEDIFQKYLDKYSLSEKKKISQLSKGMKMKYSLALALSHDAKILILDEPTGGLDPKSRNRLCEESLEQKQNGKTVFFSTHITSDLDKIGDNIFLIDNGTILFDGSKENFLKNGKSDSDDIEKVMLHMIENSDQREKDD
jgi:ABC-2 type transport system ATP-binding protein